jgi:hypothetical protein
MALGTVAWFGAMSPAQTSTQSASPQTAAPRAKSSPTSQPIDPSVVTLNIIAEDAKTSAILPKLSREDFRLYDNGRETAVVSFGAGAHYSVPPIALWLVLECNNFSQVDFASAFMRGKTQYLLPALAHLDKTDAVGVAHWCGDGTQAIDLPPGPDANATVGALNDLLRKKAIEGANRQAEDAMQRMVAMVLAQTENTSPKRLPVLVFLYGDAGFAFEYEADAVLRDLLSTSSIAYGLNNAGYHFEPRTMFGGGQIYYEIHYLSQATGGNVVGTPDPPQLSRALDYILLQMHFRYTLGFRPTVRDGKKHDLKVELTPDGQRKYADAVLRYRSQYIAVASTAASVH